MKHSHVISRLKERYNIDADDKFISNLRKYISKRHIETSPHAVVMYLETRRDGALFRVRLNDFEYYKTTDEILVITNSSFVPMTVIPFADHYKRLVASFNRKRTRRKSTPVFNKDDIGDSGGLFGQISRRLKDHYDITMTDDIWSNMNDRNYVKKYFKSLGPHWSRHARTIIDGKEVFVILHNRRVTAVIPPSFVQNKESRIKKASENKHSDLISEAIKKNASSFS